MSMIDLSVIGLKAIEYMRAVKARRKAAKVFGEACAAWKKKHRIEFILKNSAEWDQMMAGIPAHVHEAVDRAKADERNARAGLFHACQKEENKAILDGPHAGFRSEWDD